MTISWPQVKSLLDQFSSIVSWALGLAVIVLAADMIAHLYGSDIPLIPHVSAAELIYAAGVYWLTKR